MSWLSEKGYLTKSDKFAKKISKTKGTSLEKSTYLTPCFLALEILEEKDILTTEEWEKRIKQRTPI